MSKEIPYRNMPSQYSDIKCRTCASNMAAETAPRDIETLIGIILPLKKYRCRGCYTRSWHIDRQLLRTPRVIFWIPFWTFFIYGLVKGVTNESLEIVETSQTEGERTVVESAEPNQINPSTPTPVKSFGEILGNTDVNSPPITIVAATNTIDAPEAELSASVVTNPDENSAAELEAPVAPETTSQNVEVATTANEPIPSQSDSVLATKTPPLTEDIESGDSSDLVQLEQPENIALTQSGASIGASKATVPIEVTDSAADKTPVQKPSEEQPLTTTDDQNIESLAAEDKKSDSPPMKSSTENFSSSEQLWIFEQAAELFTLQIGSYRKLETAQAAALELNLALDPLLKHQQSSDGKWQYLLYGSYKTSELAYAAAETLGLKETWIRSFKDLQKNRCKTVEANSAEATYCNS